LGLKNLNGTPLFRIKCSADPKSGLQTSCSIRARHIRQKPFS
jgi:hypothetical protein